MADFSLIRRHNFVEAGAYSGTQSRAVYCTTGSADTKGSWAEIIASLDNDVSGFMFASFGKPSNDEQGMVDLGIGGAGSEQVFLPDYLSTMRSQVPTQHPIFFPMCLPKGTRIAARGQCASSSSVQMSINISFFSKGFEAFGKINRWTAYGTDTTDTSGVSIDPGGTANTKGSWTEIISSTANPIRYLVGSLGTQNNSGLSNYRFLLDVGIGGAGSEQAIFENHPFNTNGEELAHGMGFCFPISIPAGTRLSARAQCSGTGASDRTFDIALYGGD